jgi:hypothetical protein
MVLDIFCKRMDLKRQIAATNRIEKIKADRKLVAKARVNRFAKQRLRLVKNQIPFFEPAPWGGQWMKEVCDLDRSAKNYGWGFDCVPVTRWHQRGDILHD